MLLRNRINNARPVQAAAATPAPVVAVDLLRLAAALLVVAYHYATVFPLIDGAKAAGYLGSGAADLPHIAASRFGWVGVEIFFILSGYVIAGSVAHGGAAAFLRRRALRLFPAAWICATLTIIVIAPLNMIGGENLLLRWLRSIAFWPWPHWADDVYWTLGIEAAFYLTVAGLLAIGGQPGVRWGVRAIGLISAAVWAIADLSDGAALQYLINDRTPHLLLVTHGCLFAAGAEMRRMADGGRGGVDWGGVLLLALFAVGIAREVTAHEIDRALAIGVPPAARWPLAVAAAAALIVIAGRAMQPRLAWLAGPGRFAGLLTYPLYLTHNMLGAGVAGWLVAAGLGAGAALALGFAAALLLSVWIAAVAEPWLRRCLALLQPPWPSAR